MKNKDFSARLGQKIRKIRKSRGLSQEALAEKIDKTVDTVSNIERGIFQPRLDTAADIAAALGLSLHDLVDLNDVAAAGKERRQLLDDLYDLLKKQPADVLTFMLQTARNLAALRKPPPEKSGK